MAALVIILVLIILFLIFLRILYYMSFGVKKIHENVDRDVPKYAQYEILAGRILADVDLVLGAPYEPVTIQSYDGLKLCGRYYRNGDGKTVIISCHGYRSSPVRDSVGAFRMGQEQGYDVLIIEQRAHGGSEGRTITMGIKERYDCLEWIRYCVKRLGEDTKIMLIGISMGASTVLMASSLEQLPPQVKCVIADCGFSSTREMIRKVMGMMKLPFAPLYPFVRLSSIIYGRFDPEEITTAEALKNCKIPVLLIHGDNDELVPYNMSYENYEAIPAEKEILVIQNANHGISYYVDNEKYLKTVNAFTDKYLNV